MAMKYAVYNPATHVAVPREPTRGMIINAGAEDNPEGYTAWWQAMLAEAPPHVVELDPTRSDVALAKLILERLGYSVGENQPRMDRVAEEICKSREVKMLVDKEWLRQKSEEEVDCAVGAGVLHPEAPLNVGAHRQGFLAGARAMQEAAAKIASARLSDGKTEFNMGQNASAYGIASEIWRIDPEKVAG